MMIELRQMNEKYQETLTILDVEGLDNLNIVKRKTKKRQILLYDTHRRHGDFISKIKHRKNGKYENIPHFLITKMGGVFQIFNSDYYSITFGEKDIDKKQIKIAIENLGWLNKNTITGYLHNWIGDPYRTTPYISPWRGYFYWDKYTDEQYQSLNNLCHYLCEKYGIEDKLVPSQGYFSMAHKFDGIICKSNFSDIYTDINPSFNFNFFEKNE